MNELDATFDGRRIPAAVRLFKDVAKDVEQ